MPWYVYSCVQLLITFHSQHSRFQPAGAATATSSDTSRTELASVREHARAVIEARRRHGGYIVTPSGGAFPLPIRPYYG